MPGGVVYGKNWLQASGFSPQAAETMNAIVSAESGWNPQAKNVNSDGSIDRGLFQINNKYHPEVSDACAYNPQCAVKAALKISNSGTSFTPWSTYNNGAYKKYLGKTSVLGPAGDSGSVNIPPSLPNPLSGIEAIGHFFSILADPNFWLRVGEVIVGLILCYMGLHTLTGMGPSSSQIATAVAMPK